MPMHYEEIGVVETFIEKLGVVGVRLGETLNRGERIGFELRVEFHEESADSMQLDNRDVDSAPPGSLIGIRVSLTKAEAREGVRVFRVRPPAAG